MISPLIYLSVFCLIQSNGLKVFESIPGPIYVGVSSVSDPTISLIVLLVRWSTVDAKSGCFLRNKSSPTLSVSLTVVIPTSTPCVPT